MSTNKSAKQELERVYGKGCMFKKAHIEEQIEALRTIKTYRRFLQETRYTGRKIHLLESNLTYHHLKHRSEGGKSTLENGAVIGELPHRYIHSLSRQEEEIINNMFREYKFKLQGGILVPTETGIDMRDPIQIELELNGEDGYIEIPAFDTTEQDLQKRRKFNRAKEKRNIQELIDEEMEWLYSDQDDGFDR